MVPTSEYARRLIQYYSSRLSVAGKALQDSGTEVQIAIASIDQDFESIVAAQALLTHMVKQDTGQWLEEACQFGHGTGRYLALRLSPEIWREWSVLRGSYSSEPKNASKRGSALTDAGLAAKAQGDLAAARSFFEQAKEIEEEIGDEMSIAQNVGNLAVLDAMSGQTRTAIDGYRRQIAILEATGQDRLLGAAYNNLGMALDDLGDEVGALRAFEIAKTNAENSQDLVLLAGIAGNLGGMCIDMGDVASAHRYYEWQASLAISLGDRLQEAKANLGTTRVYLEKGHFTKANIKAQAALSVARELRSELTLGIAFAIYAEYLHADGDQDAAVKACTQAIDLLSIHDPIQARRLESTVRSWEVH